MAIRIKVAETSKELVDVYKLRHQVYVESEGYFKDMPGDMVIDHFDTMPKTLNVIAYSGDKPVGTIRLNCDSEILLPGDETYDFSEYRIRVENEAKQTGAAKPLIASAGMLAIAEEWRNRRDVFRSLFKMAVDVGQSWGVTHVILTVNVKSSTIYKRLGFETLSEQIWIPAIGEYILPMVSPLAPVYDWAFGVFTDNHELLDSFSGCFEYHLESINSVIFNQDDPGHEAFLISKGTVRVSQIDPETGKEFELATLGRGELFGELSLIDEHPRSATVTASSNTELVVLTREVFWEKIHEDPDYLRGLLQILTRRIREIDERAFIYAHGSLEVRLKFFINKVLKDATPLVKKPENRIARVHLLDFAYLASASIPEAEAFLQPLQDSGRLKVTNKEIIFYGDEPI
jgi:CRP-like cAMP-binding protein/predicted GNAT family N-acyltransferase